MTNLLTRFAAACGDSTTFFGLPTWYKYLSCEADPISGKPTPVISDYSDVWAIALAIIDILIRIAGMLLVAYIIYGGFQYMTSQGEPDRTAAAKNILMNAAIGLVIVMMAVVLVSFAAGLIT